MRWSGLSRRVEPLDHYRPGVVDRHGSDLLHDSRPPEPAKVRNARDKWLSAIDWNHVEETGELRVNRPALLSTRSKGSMSPRGRIQSKRIESEDRRQHIETRFSYSLAAIA